MLFMVVERFRNRGTRARKIDPSQFGTRHGSMLRYCAQDRNALGIVVSQDGYVRLIMTVRNSLLFWDNLIEFEFVPVVPSAETRKIVEGADAK